MTPSSNLVPAKPKEHGAWAMLYVPLVTALGIERIVNVQVLLLTLAVTMIFLSLRPYTDLFVNRTIRRDLAARRRNLSWLGIYWCSGAALFAMLYFHYRLIALPQLGCIGIATAAAFTFFLKKNQRHSVAGELTGICGLTLTAPLAHYAAVGRMEALGFWLWALCILYFASSVFYLKAMVAESVRLRSGSRNSLSSSGRLCGLYHAGLLLLLARLVATGKIPALMLAAFAPVIVRGVVGLWGSKARLSFVRIGWMEVAYSIVFASISILAMRLVA